MSTPENPGNLPVPETISLAGEPAVALPLETIEQPDTISLDEWHEMIQQDKAPSTIPPTGPFKRRSIGKVVLSPLKNQLGDTGFAVRSRTQRILRQYRPNNQSDPLPPPVDTSQQRENLRTVMQNAFERGQEYRTQRAAGRPERSTGQPHTASEQKYFDTQTLLDLDVAMTEAIRNAIHEAKREPGRDKLDPADLPRIKAAARRMVMRQYLSGDYSDDLSGRIETARLEAVKRFGNPTDARRQDRNRDDQDNPHQPRQHASESNMHGSSVRVKSENRASKKDTLERVWEDVVRYTATAKFSTMSEHSITHRLITNANMDEDEALAMAQTFHAKLVEDGVLVPETTVDEKGVVNGYRYRRAMGSDEIMQKYSVKPKQNRKHS